MKRNARRLSQQEQIAADGAEISALARSLATLPGETLTELWETNAGGLFIKSAAGIWYDAATPGSFETDAAAIVNGEYFGDEMETGIDPSAGAGPEAPKMIALYHHTPKFAYVENIYDAAGAYVIAGIAGRLYTGYDTE